MRRFTEADAQVEPKARDRVGASSISPQDRPGLGIGRLCSSSPRLVAYSPWTRQRNVGTYV